MRKARDVLRKRSNNGYRSDGGNVPPKSKKPKKKGRSWTADSQDEASDTEDDSIDDELVPSEDDIFDDDVDEVVRRGSHISVYWPLDDEFYDAHVQSEEVNGKFFIKYKIDGVTEWIDLKKHTYMLAAAKGGSKKKKNGVGQRAFI